MLEVGCGYGYTTYAVAKLGHEVTGIDLSKKAIEFANSNLKLENNQYINVNIFDFVTEDKFDVIYATEVIEHLVDPYKFITIAKSLLKKDGKIIITTTNKDYNQNLNEDTIWENDLPPVHIFWPTKLGLNKFISNNDMTMNFLDMGLGIYPNMNALIEYRRASRNNVRPSLVTKNGVSSVSETKVTAKSIIRDFLYLKPMRYVSAFIVKYIINYKELPTLAIIIE